jgi:hypothetical protein
MLIHAQINAKINNTRDAHATEVMSTRIIESASGTGERPTIDLRQAAEPTIRADADTLFLHFSHSDYF